ncbi:hypothetical protein MAPG_01880 [Magnaporthiopsis poae ATCC 64411]|uniref:Uncharacterized protein n=1 Tax=Magnaporthiopsis poae (strain ATCC 64411 / 73-15) TaxID=644358 RepID=A0A0C4DPV1_MAGP6|nr:hypothetical protein MAPG_01880 [Magnaporthiopsis poae ATCC 64411]
MALPTLRNLFVLLLAVALAGVAAQDAPLFVQGGLEDVTVSSDAYNAGGTVSVGGFTMQVPKNVLVQFPAAWVPFKDLAAKKAEFSGYETLVIGNYINSVPRVAQIIIYEFFEGLASGFIESVDFADGSMKIINGPKIRISDPNAVFSKGYAGAPEFTADDQSPSISSFSGFPMCIPRNTTDPLCPLSNRPFAGPGIFVAPDPLVMAPLQAGDFITWQGIRKGDEVIAFSIVAQNTQIQTLGDIVYVRMELARLGIDNPNPNAEIAETRFIGFVSNNQATVSLYAMDVDPCTGATTDRIIASMGLRGGRNAQNKFEYRNDVLRRYTREYRVTAEIGGIRKTRTTKNGLTASTYVQPVNVWIPGEQDVPGVPPVAHDFSQMAFLTQGVGADADGNIWGPLDPFPQTGLFIEDQNCNISAASAAGPISVRRRGIEGYYSRERAEAVADAENKETSDGFVRISAIEEALLAEARAEKAAGIAA